jgi:hypothetical protein
MKRLLCCVLLFAACVAREETPSAPPPPRPRTEPPPAQTAPVRTDRTRYNLGEEITIISTFTPARTVYVMNCNGAITTGLQRREGDQWTNAWIATINGCFSAPIVIEPGGRHLGTLSIREDGAFPKLTPGTYRVVWHNVMQTFDANVHPPRGEELPIEERASAPIAIE